MQIQAALVVAAVAGLNFLQAQMFAIGFACFSVIVGFALYLLRVRALKRRNEERDIEPEDGPWRRAQPDPLLSLALIFVAAAVPIHGWTPGSRADTGTEIASALAIAVSALFVSTLVDWFYVIPLLRESNDEERMLCRSSMASQWGTVTKVWLFHRLGAILGFVLGLVAAVTLLAVKLIHFNSVAGGAIAALTTIIAGYYLTRAGAVIAFAVRPAFHVGDKIQLMSDNEVERDRTYFVVDVAMEGARLLEVQGPHDVVPDQLDSWREHDRILDFLDAAKVVWRRRVFEPCAGECKRVNAYCPRNAVQSEPRNEDRPPCTSGIGSE
jgi:hypothetical protein